MVASVEVPSKNTVKVYVENGFYHIYNRGVEKRVIFRDRQDAGVFLGYLEEYLSPKDEAGLLKIINDRAFPYWQRKKAESQLKRNNFFGKMDLLCFSLMPNHFHFLVKQNQSSVIDIFTNSLITRYVLYFNRKYERVGHLFQDVYKAVLIDSEEQLLHLSRYIHENPKQLGSRGQAYQEQYTSLPEYLGQRRTAWIKTELISSYFSKSNPGGSYLDLFGQPEYVAKPEVIGVFID